MQILIQVLSAIYGVVGIIGVSTHLSIIKDLYQKKQSTNIISILNFASYTIT